MKLQFLMCFVDADEETVGRERCVRKSDLDKLMKSGNNVDPTSPLTIGAGVVPLTIGDEISPLTIDERR